jgi:iron complex transport system substrate-binding protein
MKQKNRIQIPRHIILPAILIILAIGIVPVPAVTFTDDAGTTITLNVTPLRIVSLSPSNTEILAALGLLDRIVGVTDVCDYPPEVKNKTRIGGYSAISIEKVAAAKPDLVIASDLTPEETLNRLREIGLSVFVVSPKNVDHVLRDIRMVGEITGTGDRAEELTANLSRRIATASSTPGIDHPTVAHVVWNKPLYVSGNGTMQNDIITQTGGTNVFAGRSGWGTVSLEEFLQTNPDIIIVSGGGGMDSSEKDVIFEDFMTSPQYASLSAVKNHHVYAIDANIISRPGPRVADAAEEVNRIIRAFEDERAESSRPATTPAAAAKTPGFTATAAVLGLLFVAVRARK